MGMGLTLVLVRHGETDWTAERRYCGLTDLALNETGRRQARALADLATEPFTTAWVSPLRRCRETATLIGLEARVSDALREFDFGALEGKRWDDLDESTRAGLVDFDDFVAPRGESATALGERVDAFVSSLGAGRHVLVTHGGVIRHVLRRSGAEVYVAAGATATVDLAR